MELEQAYDMIHAAIAEVGPRAAGLVRAIGDPSAPVVGSRWTLREAAVHMVTDATIHADLALGKPMIRTDCLSRAGIADDNERFIAAIPETRPAVLGDMVAGAVDSFLAAAAGRAATDEVYWTPELPVSVTHVAGLELGELVLHGYDVAATLGIPWVIDPLHAQLVLFGYGPFYATVLNRERTAGLTIAYEVHLRGGPSLVIRFADGEFRLEPGGSGAADCEIDADPVAFLLVMSGRLAQAPAIALGLLAAGGKSPELAGELTSLFDYP